MDAQVSYMRMLIGDNTPPYAYTDAQLRSAVTIVAPRPALPAQVLLAGVAAFRAYPSDKSGGPFKT